MNDFILIFRKEFLEVIRDKRTIFNLFVLPVIGIPLLLVFVSNLISVKSKETSKIVIKPFEEYDKIENLLKKEGFEIVLSEKPESLILKNNNILGLIFENNEFKILFNPKSLENYREIKIIKKVLVEYKNEKIEEFFKKENIEKPLFLDYEIKEVPIYVREGLNEIFFILIVFYFLIILLQSSIYPSIEVITGEKERKTMELLLSYPAKRFYLISGKLLVVVLLSFTSSILAILIYFFVFPKILFFNVPPEYRESLNVYFPSFHRVFLLFIFVLVLAFLISSINMVISSFARTFKEAQSFLQGTLLFWFMPLFLFLFLVPQVDLRISFIPVINFIYVTKLVFEGGKMFYLFYLISIITNLITFLILFLLLIRLFEKEDIIFRV